MRPDVFSQLINQPNTLNTQDVKLLEQLVDQYPYFQLAYTLLAKAAYDRSSQSAQLAIQHAAIYATDRERLKLLLEGQLSLNAPADATLTAHTPTLSTPQPSTPTTNVGEPDFVNSYINAIRHRQAKKITKRKSLEQLNIIENFIQQGGQFSPIHTKKSTPDANQIDLSQESTTLQDDLITESLAQVMIKQGKFQRALEIYHKLQLQFPEKKSYFSVLSEELKKEIE